MAGRVRLAVMLALLGTGAAPAWAVSPSLVQVTLSNWAIHLSHQPVKAGLITFEVRNASTTDVHEMIVIRAAERATSLPYDPKTGRVEEQKIQTVGEVSDLRPGRSGRLTVRMKPGRYILICNEPGHYKAGMVTVLTVVR